MVRPLGAGEFGLRITANITVDMDTLKTNLNLGHCRGLKYYRLCDKFHNLVICPESGPE